MPALEAVKVPVVVLPPTVPVARTGAAERAQVAGGGAAVQVRETLTVTVLPPLPLTVKLPAFVAVLLQAAKLMFRAVLGFGCSLLLGSDVVPGATENQELGLPIWMLAGPPTIWPLYVMPTLATVMACIAGVVPAIPVLATLVLLTCH